MDCNDGLHVTEEITLMELILKKHGYQSCLPVMAVHYIRLESDNRQCGQGCPAEKAEFLQIPVPVSIWFGTVKIAFIINKIKSNAFMYVLEDAYVAALSQEIHIKMVHVFHLGTPLFLYAQVLWYHDPYIEILFVKAFGQRANHVCQSSCFDKRHCF